MIETSRLLIREITLKDASFLFQLMNTPKWLHFIGDRKILNEEDAKAYIQANMHPDLNEKGFVNHVILEKSSSREIGTCSLHNREYVDGMDIGYAMLPEFEGKGYAKEAATEMVKLAFNVYGQTKISAITHEENVASQKLLGKLGFLHQGKLPIPKTHEFVSLFQLHANDFKA